MAKHRYTGSQPLIYPYAGIDGHHRPLHASPDMDPVEFDGEPPDLQWELVPERKTKTVAKATAPAEADQE